MSDVQIISSSFTVGSNAWACLRESAERCGAPPLYVFGQNRRWPGARKIYQEALEVIARLSPPYIVATDSHDVLMSRWDEQEIIALIEASPGRLIVAAEDHCWPKGPWSEVYEKQAHSTPWYAANGGQCCGGRESILKLFETYRDRVGHCVAGGGNQELLHHLLAERYPMSLDVECRIFQAMKCHVPESRGHLTVKDGRAYNSLTQTFPMFLHFNGDCPGIRDWYERLGGQNYQPGVKPQ